MTECALCGDCCTRIDLRPSIDVVIQNAECSDPRTEDGWAAWVETGWIARPDAIANWLNAVFIADHWSPTSDRPDLFECDRFEAETRLCTAHEDRPPVCSGFPWYDERPTPVRKEGLPDRCSFHADIPAVPVSIRTSQK